MPAGPWEEWVEAELQEIAAAGRYRALRPLEGRGPEFHHPAVGPVVSFASNDYLGLAAHPSVAAACAAAAGRWGTGAGSSRLIVGDRVLHHELEASLAGWKDAEAALVFPSGYQANLAALTTFGQDQPCRIVSDELNHASIIDGARLSRAEIGIYRHGDVDEAAALVAGAPGRAILVTDTVFSMDGDLAPVCALADVCLRHGALLVLDDAHAVFGVPAVDPDVACLRIGTLSKTLGSQGGFVSGSARHVELLVNRARSFIFTTGLAPPAAAAALAALEVLRSGEGEALVDRVRGHIDAVAPGHPSPIVPVIVGSEERALQASEELLASGLLVPAIRPPTVPPGTSRLRVSLSAAHRDDDVKRLIAGLKSLRLG